MTNEFWFEAGNISCFKNGYEVVKDLDLKLKHNENVIIIGPNGSGKSSLIELINRNIYPTIKKNTFLRIFNKELIAIFEKKYSLSGKDKVKNYYVRESVGIATGILISCLHFSGLAMLTHTPSPMNFLNKILKRPKNEKPFVLLVVGYPSQKAKIPIFAKEKKILSEISTII